MQQQPPPRVHTTTLSFSPFPAPTDLAAYGEVRPDLVERLVTMVEKEGDHRRAMDRSRMDAHVRGGYVGQFFGLLIGLGGLAVAALAVYKGNPVAATAITALDLVGLVSVFVGSKTKAKAAQGQQDGQQLTLPIE